MEKLIIKASSISTISLDFSGIECLTDDVFITLQVTLFKYYEAL